MITRIKAIYGPMGSGKTKKLIDDYHDSYLKDITKVFSPARNTRDGEGKPKERADLEKGILGREIDAIKIKDLFEIDKHLKEFTKRILIDETNFFESDHIEMGISLEELLNRRAQAMDYLESLARQRKNINIYGLNITAEKQPYGMMGHALALSISKEELKAQCVSCGDPAIYTYFIPFEKPTNVVGEHNYCAMCEFCHTEWGQRFQEGKEAQNLDDYYLAAVRLKPELEIMLEKGLIEEKDLPEWYKQHKEKGLELLRRKK